MSIYKILSIIALIFILGGAYFLKLHDYDKIPFPGESMDEYSFSWVGLSLIKVGFPMGSSGIGGYKSYDYRYINVDQVFRTTAKGNAFSINSPWFDHPPTLGLVTGGYAYLKGAQVFEDMQTSLIRKPMIVIGVLSVLLLFLYLKTLFGYLEALLGSLIYAVSPPAIIASRMVQAENLLVPVFLTSLLFLFLYIQKKKKLFLWLAALIAGVSLLVKLSGIAIMLSGVLLLVFSNKNKKLAFIDTLTFGVVSISFLLLFVSYGAVYDLEQFFRIFASNGGRFYGIGASALAELITTTKVTRYLTDGWFLSGWIGVFMILFKNSSAKDIRINFITIPVFTYLAVFLLFGSETYGWYRFPFQPFLFAATGFVLANAIRNYKDYLPAYFLLLIPIGVSISKLMDIGAFQNYAFYWRWGISSLIIIFAALAFITISSKKIRYLLPVFLLVLLSAAVYFNLEYFYLITTDYWRGTA